jgi:predicted phage-related endonuclease
MLEILEPKSEEEWLELRRETIGASESGALLGMHPWKTYAQLWAEKCGRVQQRAATPAMFLGRLLEPVAIEVLKKERPDWEITANVIGKGGRFYRDLERGLSCTPDAFFTSEGQHGIVQIKAVDTDVFRSTWLVDGAVQPVLYSVVQAMLEMNLTGVDCAYVAPFVIDHGPKMPIVEIPFHAGTIEWLEKEAVEFWRLVAGRIPPVFDYRRDGRLISDLYPGETGEIISLDGRDDLVEMIDEDESLKSLIKETELRREIIKNRFKEELKESSAATYHGSVIATRKIVHKKEFTVKATSYPKITLKPFKWRNDDE